MKKFVISEIDLPLDTQVLNLFFVFLWFDF